MKVKRVYDVEEHGCSLRPCVIECWMRITLIQICLLIYIECISKEIQLTLLMEENILV